MTICDRLERVRDDLKIMTEITDSSGHEQGARICEDRDGNIVLGPKTSGEEMRINEVPNCPVETLGIGLFHTHTAPTDYMRFATSTISPSPADLNWADFTGAQVMCMGNRLGNVACVERDRGFTRDDVNAVWDALDVVRISRGEFYSKQPQGTLDNIRAQSSPKTLRALEEAYRREATEKPVMAALQKRNISICQIQL